MNQNQPAAASASPAYRGPGTLRLIFALTLIAVGAWWIFRSFTAGGDSAAEIPAPDLTTANVHVATATSELQRQVREQPASPAAWGRYGEVLMAHEWNAEALICFRRASQLDAANMRWPYLAGILLDRAAPTAALEMYAEAEARDASYAPLQLRMAQTLLRLNRPQAAEPRLATAAKLAPQAPQPLIGLARLAADAGDWQRASGLLQQAVQVAPANREALVELLRAKMMTGTASGLNRDEQAAVLSGEKYEPMQDPVLQSVYEQEVAARFAASQADQIAAQGNLEQAAQLYLDLIEKRPDLSRPRLNLSSIYMTQGQLPQALATLREVVELFPDDPMGHYSLSFALEANQDLAGARRELEEAVRLKPDYAQAHFALGLLAERNGDPAAAAEAYRRAVAADARLAQAHLALGLVLQKSGQLAEAIEEMRAAVRLAPGDPVPQAYLNKALAEQGGK